MLHALALAAALAASVPQIDELTWTLVRKDVRPLLANNPALRQQSPRGLPQALIFYSCMEIEGVRIVSVEEVENGRRYLLDLAATGQILGAARTREPLPHLWSMVVREVDGRMMMTEIEREEIRLSKQLKTAGARDIRAVLDSRPDIDVDELIHHIAEYAADEGEAGREALEFSIEYTRRTGVGEAFALAMKSAAELYVGNTDAALALAQQTMRMAEETQDPDDLSGAFFAVGTALWRKGDFDPAVRAFDASFSFVDRVREPRIPLMSAHMASHIDGERGHISAVVQRSLVMRSHARELEWKEGASNAASSLGGVHLALGNNELASDAYREAHKLAYAINDRERQAFALHNLSVLASSRGDYADARTQMERALEVMRTRHPSMLHQLALIHLAQGDRAAAAKVAAEATEIARAEEDPTTLARLLALLADLKLDEGKPAEAAALAEEGVRVANAWFEGPGKESKENHAGEARIVLARSLRRLGKADAARKVLAEAVTVSESMMPELPDLPETLARYYGGDTVAHHELAALLIEEGKAVEAMAVSAKLKARSLQQILARGKVDASPSFSAAEVERERELEAALTSSTRRMLAAEREDASLRGEVSLARRELEKYRAELYLRDPALQRRRPALQAFDVATLQDARFRDALVLDFLVNEDRVLVMAIEPGRGLAVSHASIPIARDELSRRIDRYLQKLVTRDLRAGKDAAALYDLLLRPIEPALRRYKSICIVPDGPLWNVPFQTLGIGEEKAIFFVPSLSLLATPPPAKPAPATQECLAVANPSFPGARETTRFATVRSLPRQSLTDASREGRSLLEIYDRSVLLESAEATEEKVTEAVGRFRIVHFATHGIVDANAPMYSALLLASASDKEDGALEAREIADLRLSADLAVLSACDTARGKVASGEGVIGLAWAFAVAGCPRTVASQWQVDSRATADLMISFHQHIRKGVPAAEALHLAQRELKKRPRYRHPYYWAPFIVIGDGVTPLF